MNNRKAQVHSKAKRSQVVTNLRETHSKNFMEKHLDIGKNKLN